MPHWSPTRGAAFDAMSKLFFFFFFFHGFASTWLRFVLNQADLARIRSYQPNRVVSVGDRNKPKSALNHVGTAEIGFE